MIKVFTSDSCGKCAAAKTRLRELAIDFEEIDVGTPDGLAECCLLAGGCTTLPLVVEDRHVVKDVAAWLTEKSSVPQTDRRGEKSS